MVVCMMWSLQAILNVYDEYSAAYRYLRVRCRIHYWVDIKRRQWRLNQVWNHVFEPIVGTILLHEQIHPTIVNFPCRCMFWIFQPKHYLPTPRISEVGKLDRKVMQYISFFYGW